MEIEQYLEQKRDIQNKILEYIDNGVNNEENYQNLISLIQYQNILKNRQEIERILYLITKISNHHFRSPLFFNKIEKILLFMKNEISLNFSNFELFNFFKSCKRILLFLFEEKIIILDKSIVDILLNDKFRESYHPQYFFPEIKNFLNENEIQSVNFEDSEDFEKKRKTGENESYIGELVRNDLIDEFISYVNKTNLLLTSEIKTSVFETHSFLLRKEKVSLIEYSAFFGSIQIFKYLHLNGVKLKMDLFLSAIHSDNPEIIHYLEKNMVVSQHWFYREMYKEAIKCHHNEIGNYILNNYLENNDKEELEQDQVSIKYSNYCFFPAKMDNQKLFYYLSGYNYLSIVKILLETTRIDINKKVIQTSNIFNQV